VGPLPLPRPGQQVRWRDAWHAHALGWLYSYGPGPFEVVGVVDHGDRDLPAGLLLQTDLGVKEVSEFWLGPAQASYPRWGLCVLVVDDDHDAADTTCKLIDLWGYRSLVAYDAAAAWSLAVRELPDVVLLDLAMPGVDGWELARRLRAERTLDGVVLLAVSGYGREADRQRSCAAGIDAHLVKPVEAERLSRLLEQYRARHGQRLALAGAAWGRGR
jgi:CheY-like chemotaxis protein